MEEGFKGWGTPLVRSMIVTSDHSRSRDVAETPFYLCIHQEDQHQATKSVIKVLKAVIISTCVPSLYNEVLKHIVTKLPSWWVYLVPTPHLNLEHKIDKVVNTN